MPRWPTVDEQRRGARILFQSAPAIYQLMRIVAPELRGDGVDRNALLGQCDCRRQYVRQRQPPEVRDAVGPARSGAGDRHAVDAVGRQPIRAVAGGRPRPLGRQRLRRATGTVETAHRLGRGVVVQTKRVAAESAHASLRHV